MRRTSDFAYDLPEEQIAQIPADRRDASRLLVVGSESVDHRRLAEIVDVVPNVAVLVVNDTRVIAARLAARKPTGGAVELFLVEPVDAGDHCWRCIARASKPIRDGAVLDILEGEKVCAQAKVVAERDAHGHIVVELSKPALELSLEAGQMPLPPYIARPDGTTAADLERYQTVYAAQPGAVAAPTAGLNITEEILEGQFSSGVDIPRLNLQFRPGKFAPERTDENNAHSLHFKR